jgi:hypothetical protein
MNTGRHLRWVRIVVAAVGAVVAPILALIALLVVYGITRRSDSPTPEAFAPMAGEWVGPIGGFLATIALSYWAARRPGDRPIAHGFVVGVLSAVLDYVVGALILRAPFQAVYLLYYAGRVIAGLVGGWAAMTRMTVYRHVSVAGTPAQLWRCLTEIELLKQWIATLVDEALDDPNHTGLGALSTIQLREGTGVVSYRSLVTAWEPHQRLGIRLSGGSFADGMVMDVTYRLSPSAGVRTGLTYDVCVALEGKFRVMGPLIWMVSASNARRDLAKLQALAPTLPT